MLLEAMALGTAVVATDCPSGPAEILCGGKLGRLVSPGDDKGLAAAIDAALDATPQRDALRARAADFTVARAAEQYERLLLHNVRPVPGSAPA